MNEEKLRTEIRKLIKEEIQLEKAPKMKTHPAQKGLSDVISQIGVIGRQVPNNIYSKKVHQKLKVAIRAIQAAQDALKTVPPSLD